MRLTCLGPARCLKNFRAIPPPLKHDEQQFSQPGSWRSSILPRMSKDEVDTQRARQYAWTLKFSDETELEDDAEESAPPSEPDAEPGAAKASSEPDLDAWRSKIHAKAESLAAAVERVWNGTMSAEQQAQKVKSLVASATELGLGMFALTDEPLSLVRLARLVNRHWHRLSAESRQAACGSLIWSRFEPPLAVELLVEICRDGNAELASALSLPLFRDEPGDESQSTFLTTGLAAQLIVLLEAADSLARPWASRLIALDWLQLAPVRSAVPVVRRMLRLAHLEIRWRALALLVKDYTPPALLPEDILFLLQDLLVHPPDSERGRGRFETSYRYSTFLHEAIATLRPEGGAELLVELAFEGRGEYLRLGYQGHWAGKWALTALSAAYPERALPFIERCMRSGSSYVRLVAVEAASELPEEPARLRLIALAADGAPRVAEPARDRFIKRFATPCPVAPLDGFPVELLVAPPSESLHGRLLCLRGPSSEARAAMVEVLLAEAPCSEALALLTFALCDDDLLRDNTRRRLPKDMKQMCARLYRQFGGPAIAALCWLVDRYPEAGLHDWLYQVSCLVTARKVRKRDRGPLRSLAARWLAVPDPKRQRRALEVLADVGAPAEHMERLLTLAWLDEPSSYSAGQVLKKWPADRTLDARILKVAQESWANREVPRLALALKLGFHRRIPALDPLAQEILAAWLDYAAGQRAQGRRLVDPLVELPLSLAAQCVSHLRNQNQLDAATIQKWLTAPQAPAFLLATYQPPERSAATKRALFAALEAPTTPKEAAQEAATVLMQLGYLSPDDPRVRELIDEASHQLRFWVMHHIVFGKCKKRTAHRLAVAALLKTVPFSEALDPDLSYYLPRLAQAVGAEAVKQALTELPDRELRNRLLAIVCPDPQPKYWQDVSEVPN